MDIRQTKIWASYLESLGWKSDKLASNCFLYLKKIPLLGATAKIPRVSLPIPLVEINKFLKKENVFMVKLDPDIEAGGGETENIETLLKKAGFKKDNWSLSPTKTFVIDLSLSEETLLKNLEKDTRYNVRLAERSGLIVKEGSFEEFKKLYFDTAQRKRFWPAKTELEALWKIFSKEKAVIILTAYLQQKPLASALFLINEEYAHYYHAASSPINRNLMAPYLLLWESMLMLKQKGVKSLDLEGIYDGRYKATRGWKGFTLFKKGFGGVEKEFIGSYVKYPTIWSKILFFPSRFF